jgi:hypothetical protein
MDIVQKLRNHALPDPHDEREVLHAPLLTEAANEIERLRALVQKHYSEAINLDADLAKANAKLAAAEKDAAKYRAINTPEIEHFLQAVHNEALHQRERWDSDHDAGKEDTDWYWLIGYLAGKAIRPNQTREKVLHHIITTAAVCLNWHAARIGTHNAMRPGIEPPDAAISKEKE